MTLFTIRIFSNQIAFSNSLKATFLLLLFFQLHFFAKAQIPVRPKLSIQLLLNTNPGSENTADGAAVFYDDSFSSAIGDEDSYKWTNLDENLGIECKGQLLSIEGRATINGSDTIQLKMWEFRQTSYYLKLAGTDFPPTITAVVKDHYLNQETSVDLSSSTLISFNLTADSASFAANRFSITLKAARASMPNGTIKFSSIFDGAASLSVIPNPVRGDVITVRFNSVKKGRYEVLLYSSAGQPVYAGFVEHDGASVTQTISIRRRINKGIYRMFLSSDGQTISRSILFQ